MSFEAPVSGSKETTNDVQLIILAAEDKALYEEVIFALQIPILAALGNCQNFISFGYAAQSLLAALGSVQFVSNIAFAYFVLIYTPEQLSEKYINMVFLFYCMILLLIVATNHYIYRKGEVYLSTSGHDISSYWCMSLPFSYAMVSGAVGSCSVLFAKSLSNMLRLTMSSNYEFHSWFTYSMLLLFLSTAGFWMARLNEGLSLFDAILIVPMFQIAWTFFSICTGFVYFQEYQVFDALRITMFIMGMAFVFVGISLLAPDDFKGGETKGSSLPSTTHGLSTNTDRLSMEESGGSEVKSILHTVVTKAKSIILKAKAACSLSVGLGEETLSASSVLVMPMVSSRTTGFRGDVIERVKLDPLKSSSWTNSSVDDDDHYDDTEMEARSLLA